MRRAVDSSQGSMQYSRRLATTVDPVFAILRRSERLCRFTLRGMGKVVAQWQLFYIVHNIEKLAHSGWRR